MHPELTLVTGAAGFVGRHLCRHLCRHLAGQEYDVRGSVRAGARERRDGIDYMASGEIDETTDWRPLLEGVEAVVHAAGRVHVSRERAPDPRAAFRRVNAAGTARLARQAAEAGVRRFVYLSSIKAREVEQKGVDAPGLDPYQISKYEGELALARAAEGSAMETVVLRPPLVYGPGAAANFALLARAVGAGWPLPLASIRNRRGFIYVGNLCDGIAACLTHENAAGRVFELSDGAPVSTPAFVRAIATALGRPARLVPCPPGLLRLGAAMIGRPATAERLIGDLVSDDRPIREALGWRAPVALADAMAASVAEIEPNRR